MAKAKITPSSLIIFLCAFIAWLLIMGLMMQPVLLAAALVVLAAIQLFVRYTNARLAFAVLVTIIDSVWEIGMIRVGQYVYHAGLPSLGGMPLWLPVAWIIVGFAIIELYEFLTKRIV